MKQEMTGWQKHQLDHMQIICILLQADTTPASHHSVFIGRMPFLQLPNQQRESTEGNDNVIRFVYFLGRFFGVNLMTYSSRSHFINPTAKEV